MDLTPPPMLQTIIGENANANITYKSMSAFSLDTDEITGNAIPFYTEKTVRVSAKFKNYRQEIGRDGGVGENRQYLVCRLVDPLNIDDWGKLNQKGIITFDNGEKGEVTIDKYTQNPYTKNGLGAKFYCYYRRLEN